MYVQETGRAVTLGLVAFQGILGLIGTLKTFVKIRVSYTPTFTIRNRNFQNYVELPSQFGFYGQIIECSHTSLQSDLNVT